MKRTTKFRYPLRNRKLRDDFQALFAKETVKVMCQCLMLVPMLMLSACQSYRDVVTQVSSLESHEEGTYQGSASLRDIKRFGDMGLGSVSGADKLLILINDDFYRIGFNGEVDIPSRRTLSSFAVVTQFEPTLDKKVDHPMNLNELQSYLDGLIPDQSTFCMFYIRGNFRQVVARNSLLKKVLYVSTKRTVPTSSSFEVRNQHGTLLGIRVPADGEEEATYRFFYLNEPRNRGGFVVDAILSGGRIRVDTQHREFQTVML